MPLTLLVKLSFFGALFIVFQGCTVVNPLPLAARAGDTVMLAVGSPDGMTTSNTNINYIPDNDPSNVIDVTTNIRAISKVYPDKMSGAWLASSAAGVPEVSAHGPWLTVVTLDLPTTLPVGTGEFHVSTQPEVSFPRFAADVNQVPIDFEVLPGVGQTHDFSYRAYTFSQGNSIGALPLLSPMPHVLVAPPVPALGENNEYGAIEIKLHVPARDANGVAIPDNQLVVVQDDQPYNIHNQVQMIWSRTGDDFTVRFISPVGTMRYYQARFSIVFVNYNLDTSTAFSQPPLLTSINYFDVDGNEVTGPLPSLVLR